MGMAATAYSVFLTFLTPDTSIGIVKQCVQLPVTTMHLARNHAACLYRSSKEAADVAATKDPAIKVCA
jgi:hypothetical protein